jgi:hypothetical protein
MKQINWKFHQTNAEESTCTSFFQEDVEHDDIMNAEDYECREYYRNGWDELRYERQRF